MKRIFLIFIIVVLVSISGVLYFLFFTSPFSQEFAEVSMKKGLVNIKFNEDIVPAKEGGNNQGITFCSFIKKNCQDYMDILPGSFEYERLTNSQKECVHTGCLVWGIPQREEKTFELTEEQVLSLWNDYRPLMFGVFARDVKIKFHTHEASLQVTTALGVLYLKLVEDVLPTVRIFDAYLGRIIQLPQNQVEVLESRMNNFLEQEWYGMKLRSFEFQEGKVSIQVAVPKEIIQSIEISEE